jgi:predicted  nucleic acid-binding Zn-ribbon protein
MRRAASPPHLKVASINVQEIRVANRIEFSNAVSLNAAIVQKILSRLQAASKDLAILQTTTQNEINSLQTNLGQLATDTQNQFITVNNQMASTESRLNTLETAYVDLLPRVISAEQNIISINQSLKNLEDDIKTVTDLLSSSIVIL